MRSSGKGGAAVGAEVAAVVVAAVAYAELKQWWWWWRWGIQSGRQACADRVPFGRTLADMRITLQELQEIRELPNRREVELLRELDLSNKVRSAV